MGKVTQCLELPDKESSIHVWQAFNALFIIRTLMKYMIETGSEYQLLQQFESIPIQLETTTADETTTTNTSTIAVTDENNSKNNFINKIVDGSKFETFFDALVNIIVVIPVKDFTYHLHLEAVNSIITLMSINLFSQQQTEKSTIFK